MSELRKGDIIQTVAVTVSAYALALGILGLGIDNFYGLVGRVEAQQASLENIQHRLNGLIERQEEREKEIDEILEWIRKQQAEDQGSAE